jgi:hypothetical protein
MQSPKIDTSGQEAASRAIADAQTAANNLKTNFAADLTNDNLTQVVAGGSATANDASVTSSGTRKRRSGDSLSSQLGISV